MSPKSTPIGIQVLRTQDGALQVNVRYSYVRKPAPKCELVELARQMLAEALDGLDGLDAAEQVGFREDATERVRVDQLAL